MPSLTTARDRRFFVAVILVGAVGGLAGSAFVGAMHLLERVLWPDHWSTASHLLILVGVGIVVATLTRLLGTPGDVELLVDNIHVMGGSASTRDLRSLVPISLLCIASGGAVGPEAPLVQTTGVLGSWIARRYRYGVGETRILTITGMAAGFTVLFGAPLGSAVFALEILHRRGLQYYEALLPAVVGALTGFAVHLAVSGTGLAPVWSFPPVGSLRAIDLAWAIVCGCGGAAVAVVFSTSYRFMSRIARLSPTALRPVLGGAALGLLALWSPYALTFGETQIASLARHPLTAVAFLVAVAAKIVGTTLTMASGWRGGFIIPMFFIGVALAGALHAAFPSTNVTVVTAALIAASVCAVMKTPLGSTLVVAEMIGMPLVPPVLLAAITALLLTSRLGLIGSQRDRVDVE